MERTLKFTVDQTKASSVIEYLREKQFSGNILHTMKQSGGNLRLNGSLCYGSSPIRYGDTLTVRIPDPEVIQAAPVEYSLDILYEDEDLIVINKPSDMPVHPSIGNYENTLANAIAWHQKEAGESYPFRCINRLDRDTTGLLILAKNPYSASLLGAQIRERRIRRTYLALAEGMLPEKGRIDVPIARREDSVLERVVDQTHGEKAVTDYRRIDYNGTYSLAEIHLQTGRTHQIRVHMKHIGHPLPGDFLYNPDMTFISRQALHSASLTFMHPVTGKPVTFASEMPEDMQNAWSLSRALH